MQQRHISAFIPQDKGSLIEEEKQASLPSMAPEVIFDEPNNSLSLPLSSPQRIRDLFYNTCEEEDVRYALSHLQAQPLQPFRDPISISEERFGRVA